MGQSRATTSKPGEKTQPFPTSHPLGRMLSAATVKRKADDETNNNEREETPAFFSESQTSPVHPFPINHPLGAMLSRSAIARKPSIRFAGDHLTNAGDGTTSYLESVR